MIQRAFRYRFYPTPEQEQLLRRTLGCVRLVYNKALHTRTQGWYAHAERIDYKQTSAMLTDWKKQEDLQFLNHAKNQQWKETETQIVRFGNHRRFTAVRMSSRTALPCVMRERL